MRNADEKSQTAEEGITMDSKFFLFLILGFVLVFAGIIAVLVAVAFFGGGSANFGTVIFIGPFPIVIGVGPDTTLIVLFSIILAVLSVIVFIVMSRRVRVSNG